MFKAFEQLSIILIRALEFYQLIHRFIILDFGPVFNRLKKNEGGSGLYKGIGCVLLKFSLLYGGILLAHGVAKKFVMETKTPTWNRELSNQQEQ